MNACCVVVLNKENSVDNVKVFHADAASISVARHAEKYFADVCKHHGITDDETIKDATEDGYFDFEDGWSVSITWPLTEKVYS
jgi:hypothetical protein